MSSSNTNLGWALTALLRDYLKQVDDVLSDLPGSARGYMMLSAIAEANNDSQVALAERLGLDRTTVTYLLDGLEAEQLVRRTPDPADRRVRHVNLTDQGKQRLGATAKAVEAVEDRVLGRLAPADARELRHLLGKASGLVPDMPEQCQAARETTEYLAKT